MFYSDSLYHRLFSHPRMVEDLVREFVLDSAAADLDFSGLQRINAKCYAKRQSARWRECDVIWKLPTREGIDIYLCLLIEFRSQNAWRVATRTPGYQGLLWQQVIEESGARLPSVLLLVLYSGERCWKAPTEITELITLPPDSPWHLQPQVRCCVLDAAAFAGAELARRASLSAFLFRLERRQTPEELSGLINEVVDWFPEHADSEPLTQLFKEVVQQAIENFGVNFSKSEYLEEMRAMLWTYGDTWKAQWRAEGLAQGEAKALVRLLVKRFGPLGPSLHTRIQAADLATIESWFDRAIDAPDLTAVFDLPR